MRINREDATSIYETIKDNYLNNGIDVRFYRAESIRGKYEIKNKVINNVDEYLKDLEPSSRLPDDD